MSDKVQNSPKGLLLRLGHLDKALRQTLDSVSDLQGNLDSGQDGKSEITLELLQLEQELNRLSSELVALQGTHNPEQTKALQSKESHAVVMSSIAATADESDANRMIVGIQGKGNLKVVLQDEITTIGREPGNDLQIRSRFVSRYHARIVNENEGAIIEDLESINGVYVNAERISRKTLHSGDFIKIGRVHLQYIDITESDFGGSAA